MNDNLSARQITKSEEVWAELQSDLEAEKEISVERIGEVFKVLVADYLKGPLGLEELALACNDLYYQILDSEEIDRQDPELAKMIDGVYELWIRLGIEENAMGEVLKKYVGDEEKSEKTVKAKK